MSVVRVGLRELEIGNECRCVFSLRGLLSLIRRSCFASRGGVQRRREGRRVSKSRHNPTRARAQESVGFTLAAGSSRRVAARRRRRVVISKLQPTVDHQSQRHARTPQLIHHTRQWRPIQSVNSFPKVRARKTSFTPPSASPGTRPRPTSPSVPNNLIGRAACHQR